MKEKILNNFSLKVLSAICAIILWAVIVNIYDPSTSVTISGVSVQLVNEEALTNKGYTYQVVDGSKISVYISGPRSIVSDIQTSDIVATADLSDISAFADYVDIDVKVVKSGISTSAIEVVPKTTAIKLDIENREIKTYDVEIETTGTLAAGYIMSDRHILPTTVKVTGASSAISTVAKAKAVYDVTGANSDIIDNAVIQLYDADGNVISDSRIEMNRETVEFRATIQQSKTVPVNFTTTGNVATGYTLTGMEYSMTEVSITGSDSVLKQINSIDIPSSAIDVSGLTADREYSIDVTKYVADGVKITSNSKVTAIARVSASYEKEISIPVSSISVTNLNSAYTLSYGNITSVNVVISGLEKNVNAITAADLKPVINVNGLAEGTAYVNLILTLPTGCTLKQDYSVAVAISANNSQQESTGATVSN